MSFFWHANFINSRKIITVKPTSVPSPFLPSHLHLPPTGSRRCRPLCDATVSTPITADCWPQRGTGQMLTPMSGCYNPVLYYFPSLLFFVFFPNFISLAGVWYHREVAPSKTSRRGDTPKMTS